MRRHRLVLATALLSALLISSTAVAAAPGAEAEALGLSFELGMATAYVFRGWNVFQQGSQSDQNALIAPGISYQLAGTGVTLGYWGGLQLTGDNISSNNDIGLGLEQDLYLGYEITLLDALSLGGGLIYYFYPFADAEAAGTSVPSYLEPYASVSYSWHVDVGLNIAYLAGLQEAVSLARYLYINPTVARHFDLHPGIGFDVGVGLGFKLFNEPEVVTDNSLDALLQLAVPLELTGPVSVKPSLNLAWTNIEGSDLSEQFVVWGALDFGVDG